MFAGQELRSTDRPIYGSSALTINDTVYFYGGYYATPPWNMEALWSISTSIDTSTLKQLPTNPYASPTFIYGQLLDFNNSLYTFGGHNPTNISDTLPPEPLRYYKLSLDTLEWTPLQKKTLDQNISPLERYWHSTVSFREKAFLFGGMNMTGPLENDYFWIYEFLTDSWQKMSLSPSYVPPRCGHTASMLNDGQMVLLGGYQCVGNYTTNSLITKSLFSMDQAVVYNTITNQWRNQSLGGINIPDARTYHSSVTTKENQIIICGGQDGNAQPFQTYISSLGDMQAMTAILDTKQWIWKIPSASIENQPFPRSFAAAAQVNDSQMVFGFGLNHQTIYDGLYIFDAKSENWIPESINDQSVQQHEFKSIAIIGAIVALGVIIILVLLFACYTLTRRRYACRFKNALKRTKTILWNPRAGEPFWTEVTRTFCRFFFFSIFIIVIVIIVLQIRNSPIIEEKYYMENENYTINVPDIRFCFDGWTPGESPIVHCSTDYGTSCTHYMINITEKIQTGLDYYGDPLTCFLFRAPDSFQLSRTSDRRGIGSYLKFHYYGNQPGTTLDHDTLKNNSQIHIVFYNKYHNPNIPVYNITTTDNKDTSSLSETTNFEWYSPEENAQFQSTEQENLRTENAYDVKPDKVTTSSYELIERQEIQTGNIWNYAGVGTIRNTRYQITSSAMTESAVAQFITDPPPLGALHVFPKKFKVTVLQEQRAFTFVNGMGVIGGISGLIIGLQASLFGYRPHSPWGIVHRWSVGQLRQSLLNGLKSKFPEVANVPIVHPVQRRFSVAGHIIQPTDLSNHQKLQKKLSTEPATWDQQHSLESKPEGSIKNPSIPIYQVDNETFCETEEENTTVRASIEEEDDDETSRMARLEERLHVFELLFQAYYINDEVFRSLAFALKANVQPTTSNDSTSCCSRKPQ
ncbi:hypothetical protein INT45_007601 [Circinella minor]|uniref:Attractin/MKLN-like beta-propeller domain-containing protein n=1 Tax=Circinella minor TaxID=1195481 RepID=A0A8H7RW09_9FUNG|nr:hypothetical protein INT45_007601 [Circinella minor]